MIAVVDYGAGNVQSVANALDSAGVVAQLTTDPAVILAAPGVIVPGVGAAQDTMGNLEAGGLIEPVLEVIRRDVPFLGICMGMQALMSHSEEHGGQPCLDVIPGVVRELSTSLPVPHMGWNQLRYADGMASHPLLAGIPDGTDVYFVHSFVCVPNDPSWIMATTDYDGPFVSMVGRNNLMGVQFHPEKSGVAGLRLLANFADIVARGGVAASADVVGQGR